MLPTGNTLMYILATKLLLFVTSEVLLMYICIQMCVWESYNERTAVVFFFFFT